MSDPLTFALSVPLAVCLLVDLLMLKSLARNAAKFPDSFGLARMILVIAVLWFAAAAALAAAGWALASPIFLMLALVAAAPPVVMFGRKVLLED